MPGEAVDEIILAAVGFIGDDDDIPPVAKDRVLVALLLGQEFLDGREDTPPAGPPELVLRSARLSTWTGGCRRRSWQRENVPKSWSSRSFRSVMTTIVGFSIVGCRMIRPAIESHGQALPRALRMPDDADPPVARFAPGLAARLVTDFPSRCPRYSSRSAQSLFYGDIDRVELVIAGDLLLRDTPPPEVLENDEVPDQIEKSPLYRRRPSIKTSSSGMLESASSLPSIVRHGLNHSLPAPKHADSRLDTIGGNKRGVGSEERRNLGLIGLELAETPSRWWRSHRPRS